MDRMVYLPDAASAEKAEHPRKADVRDLDTPAAQVDHDALFFLSTCMYAKEALDAHACGTR